MAQYKVLKKFKDTYTKEVYKVDAVIELTEERADEIAKNLKKKGVFIELIPEEEPFDRETVKERLVELGVEFKGNAKNETLKQLLEENEKKDEEEIKE